MKFTSETYPQLHVHDLGVRFVDGEAEVTDAKKIEALRNLPEDMGVRAVDGGRGSSSSTSRKPKTPAKTANKPTSPPAGDPGRAPSGDVTPPAGDDE